MGAKYTFYGHGTHMIETGGHKLLVDPFFTGNPAAPIGAEQAEADLSLSATATATTWATRWRLPGAPAPW